MEEIEKKISKLRKEKEVQKEIYEEKVRQINYELKNCEYQKQKIKTNKTLENGGILIYFINEDEINEFENENEDIKKLNKYEFNVRIEVENVYIPYRYEYESTVLDDLEYVKGQIIKECESLGFSKDMILFDDIDFDIIKENVLEKNEEILQKNEQINHKPGWKREDGFEVYIEATVFGYYLGDERKKKNNRRW